MSDNLTTLADRIEALREESAVTDSVIFATMHPDLFENAEEAAFYVREHARNRADWYYLREIGMPSYTGSLDDAAKLIPEGCFLRFYGEGVQAIIVRPFSGSWREVSRAFGVVPGAVIAAAALRAHASEVRTDG